MNQEDRIRQLEDRFLIQDVIARYARGQDDHQGDDGNVLEHWNDVFTEDAVLDYSQAGPSFGVLSPSQLAKVMRGEPGAPGFMNASFMTWQHMLGMPTITITGDHAHAKTDLLATHHGRSLVGTSWHLFDACIFHDRLVRTSVGWRIEYRRLEVHYVEVVKTLDASTSIPDLVGRSAADASQIDGGRGDALQASRRRDS